MAEFVDVLRQFDRMCKANAVCYNCPLHEPDGVSDRCSIGAFVNDSKRIEREVMQWAAEHPEPVYPTWKEWLEEQRVVVHFNSVSTKGKKVKWELTDKSNCPIPDEIAQKLGLEPKGDA